MNIFLIQPGLSEAIVKSQVLKVVSRLNKVEINNYIFLHISEKSIYGNKDEAIIYYNDYLKTLYKCNEYIGFVYTRSYVIFIKLYIFRLFGLKKYKILFDFRGLGSAETFARKNSKPKERILNFVERFVYQNADIVHSVSYFLKVWMNAKWGERKVSVVPCCVETVKRKEKNNFRGEMKFVYVGNASFWQKMDDIIHLYKKIELNIENASFTIITKDKEKVMRLLRQIEIEKFEVKSLSHDEVLEDLVNYDFGFLLRDNILMNNVASPVKFVEYISRGVIPIISEGIGDYSSLVVEQKLGIIVKNKDIDINDVNLFYEDENIHNRLFECSINYTWDTNLQSFFNYH